MQSPSGISLLCLYATLWLPVTTSEAVECVTCTYTFAGDGSTDYECIDDVYNFTKTSVAECAAGLCTVRTVYTNGYNRINSLHRGCGASVINGCDQPDSVYPTCTITCSTPRCNDQNGDLWSSLKASGDVGGGGNSELAATASSLSFIIPITCCLFGKSLALK